MMNMPTSLGTNSMIANLLSTIFVKKWDLDMTYLGLIFAINLAIIEYATNNISNFANISFDKINLIYLLVVFVVAALIFAFKSKIKRYYNVANSYYNNEMTITIYDPQNIRMYITYMKNYSQFFDEKYNVNVGDIDKITNLVNYPGEFHNLIFPQDETKINFNDENLGIAGYVVCKNSSHELISDNSKRDNPINVNVKELQINIRKSTSKIYNAFEFKEKIKKSNTKYTDNNNMVDLCYKKVSKPNGNNSLYDTLIDYYFYEGTKKSIEENEKIYIDSFFHKEKAKLWNYLKKIDQDPLFFTKNGQSPQMNLLLYGPPGTGKSSFAYRIANTLQRNIMSLEMHKMKKQSIYNLMYDPDFCHEGFSVNNVIYVFDEFDTIVEHLYKKEKAAMRDKSAKDKIDSELDAKIINLKAKVKFLKSQLTERKEDTSDNETSNHKSGSNDLVLKDLLEIFQGIVPTNGRIIIATTNNYPKLQKICPALFRHGRLTPVEFGYLDSETFKELCNYYFPDSKIEFDFELPEKFNIATSEIIELAFESKFNQKEDAFEYFCHELKKKLTG